MTAYVADERARYQIRVDGRLEGLWAARLGEMAMDIHSDRGDTVTELTGWGLEPADDVGAAQRHAADPGPTGNESYRFRHSSQTAKARIKAREQEERR